MGGESKARPVELEVDEMIEAASALMSASIKRKKDRKAVGLPEEDTRTRRMDGIVKKIEKALEWKGKD